MGKGMGRAMGWGETRGGERRGWEGWGSCPNLGQRNYGHLNNDKKILTITYRNVIMSLDNSNVHQKDQTILETVT